MNLKILTVVISTFLLFSNIVLAETISGPGIPHQFYGSVTVNGSPAPDGTTVTAKINGVVVAGTTTSGGKYGYNPIFYVSDSAMGREGEEIVFFVNDVNTGKTALFANGGRTELNLAVNIETTSGGSSSSSGGGVTSGGGSTTSTEEETTEEQGCQERWTCSDWGECVNGIQTRICVDENNCGTNTGEPFTSQPCVVEEAEASAGPIGFFLLSPTNLIIGSIIGVIVAIIIILVLRMRKPKTVVHMVKV